MLLRKHSLAENVDLDLVSESTPGFVGADLASLVQQATFKAVSRKLQVTKILHMNVLIWCLDNTKLYRILLSICLALRMRHYMCIFYKSRFDRDF